MIRLKLMRLVFNNEILKYVSCLQKFPGSSCSKIIKKEFLLNNNLEFREKIVNEDIDFMIKCFKKAKKIYHSNSSWYMYRQNVQGSVTNTISPKSCEDMFIVINDTINNANESNLLYINRILCYEYSTLFFYYARLKNEDKEKLKKLFRANRNLLLYRGIKEKIIYIFYSLFGLDYTSKLIYRVYKMKKGEKG